MKNAILLLIPVTIICLFHCDNKPTAGTGSGTGNALSGRIIYHDGSPAKGASVYVIPVDNIPSYDVKKILSATVKTTDDNGYYDLSDINSGVYNIEAAKDTYGAFLDSISVVKDADIPDGILSAFGAVTGIIHMEGQNDTNQVRAILSMPGTRRITIPNIGGKFLFDFMPEGSYQLIINPTLPDYNVKVLDIIVLAGDTLDLDTVWISSNEPDTVEIVATSVSGEWGPNKVYKIMNDIEIPSGDSLAINAGTRVLVMGVFGINVRGNLVANGDTSNPIFFNYGHDTNVPSWTGILVYHTCNKIEFSYCVFEKLNGLYLGDCRFADGFVFHNNIVRDAFTGLDMELVDSTGSVTVVYNNIFHRVEKPFRFEVVNPHIAKADWLIKVINNIFIHSATVFCDYHSPFSLENDYNCYFEYNTFDGSCSYSGSLDEVIKGVNDLFVNPQLNDTTRGNEDYHLQPGSPCIGTGYNGTDMGIYSTFEGWIPSPPILPGP